MKNIYDDWKEELEQFAPSLLSVEKHQKTKDIPTDFFSNLADKVFEKAEWEEEISQEASILVGLKEKNKRVGQDIPPDYFKTLESQVLQIVRKEEKMPVRLSYRKMYIKQIISIAASVLLLLGVGVYVFYPMNTNKTAIVKNNLEELSPEIAYTYIQENIQDFDETIILEHLTAKNTNNLFLEDIDDKLLNDYINSVHF